MKVQIRNMGESAVELNLMGPREMLASLGALITGQAMILDTPNEENEIRVQAVKEPENLVEERALGSHPPYLSEEEIAGLYAAQSRPIDFLNPDSPTPKPFTGVLNATVTVEDGVITKVNDRTLGHKIWSFQKESE